MIKIENHIRWSLNKFGDILIFDRLRDGKILTIKSNSGKLIWEFLAKGNPRIGVVSINTLLEILSDSFSGMISTSCIKEDMEYFLSVLLTEGLIDMWDSP